MACCREKVPIRGVLVVIGGFIIHLTIGTQLTFGNTNPYFVSYLRKEAGSSSDLKYVHGIWVQACMLMGQGVTMFLGGIMEHKLGLRMSCLLGCWVLSAGVVLTYWSLQFSFVTSVLTYGVMFGLGCGIAYPMPVTCAMRWFPNHRGLMSGLIFVGFGLGSTVFNQIITLYLNPDNLAPDLSVGEDVYFTQEQVLERVPSLFLVLGGSYAAMQLMGVLLMVNPPPPPAPAAAAAAHSCAAREGDTNSVEQYETHQTENGQETAEKIWHTDTSQPTEKDVPADVTHISINNKPPSKNNNNETVISPVTLVAMKAASVNFVTADESIHTVVGLESENGVSPSEKSPNNEASIEKLREAEKEDDTSEDVTQAVDMDVPPLEMLKNRQFYLVWLLFLFGGMGGVFMASMYKSYGQSFIKDDQFIAVVGSCAAMFNALGAIVWGHIADRFSFHVAAKILYTLFACTSFTFVGSEFGMKPYFLIWVCLILFAISGKFTIMPPVIARMFGNKYMSVNYGLLYTSQILTAAASAFMGEMLKDLIHYNGLFFLIGSMSCLGFLITFFVDARTPDGKPI